MALLLQGEDNIFIFISVGLHRYVVKNNGTFLLTEEKSWKETIHTKGNHHAPEGGE